MDDRDERGGDPVTVEVVEVVAVDVDVDVRGAMEVVLDVVDEVDVEDVEELVGDCVTVCWTVAVTVLPTTPLQIAN